MKKLIAAVALIQLLGLIVPAQAQIGTRFPSERKKRVC